jgi:hypothetical protein
MFSRRRGDAEKIHSIMFPALPVSPCPRERTGLRLGCARHFSRKAAKPLSREETPKPENLLYLLASWRLRESSGFWSGRNDYSHGGTAPRRNHRSGCPGTPPRLRVSAREPDLSVHGGRRTTPEFRDESKKGAHGAPQKQEELKTWPTGRETQSCQSHPGYSTAYATTLFMRLINMLRALPHPESALPLRTMALGCATPVQGHPERDHRFWHQVSPRTVTSAHFRPCVLRASAC